MLRWCLWGETVVRGRYAFGRMDRLAHWDDAGDLSNAMMRDVKTLLSKRVGTAAFRGGR